MTTKKFTKLGVRQKGFPDKPNKNILDSFNNQHPESLYLVPLICAEFTSICPITGQPDFGSFEIVYVPNLKMVESKSLKLYLFSFRNHGEFHEDVTNRIFNDLWQLMQPKFMRIIGNFNARGGIAIKPLVQKFSPPAKKYRQEILDMLIGWDQAQPHL